MNTPLATRFCGLAKERKTAQLAAEVAGFRPEDDPGFRAGMVIHSFSSAADDVAMLSDAELRDVLLDLHRTVRKVRCRLYQAAVRQ